jgi:chromosome segregation ATPase
MISATRNERVRDGDGRYDFERLERSVEFLIHEHQRLSAEREALLGELLEREHRISSLESRLEAERATRATAVESVNKILSRLEQLQSSVSAAAEPSR